MVSREGEGRLSQDTWMQSPPLQPSPCFGTCPPCDARALSPHCPAGWSQSGPGEFATPPHWLQGRERTAPRSPTAASSAKCTQLPLGFCRYHHTAPINSFFSLREGLAMLAELVSGAGQAGGTGSAGGAWGSGGCQEVEGTFCVLLSAHRVWRARGNATGPAVPSCARVCGTWGLSSS